MSALEARLRKHIDNLPVLRMVVAKLMGLNPHSETYFDEVTRLVESEPNFSARLLSVANSTASAPRTPVMTVKNAVARLGSLTASNLVLALSVVRVFVPRDDWEKSLWRHAILVAVMSRILAKTAQVEGLDADLAYSAGLLHDIGRFVMFQEAPADLRRVDEGHWHSPEELVAEEKKICGVTHSELGAIACKKWSLPQLLVDVVAYHHMSKAPQSSELEARVAELIRLSDLVMFPSAALGTKSCVEMTADEFSLRVAGKIPAFLKLDVSKVHALTKQAAESAEAVIESLGMPSNG